MKAFIIYLPSREHSVKHSAYMKDTLKNYGFTAELFRGTDASLVDAIFEKEERVLYPYGIKSRDLNRDEIEKFLKDDLPIDFWETYNIQMNEKFKWTEDQVRKHSGSGTKGCFHSHFRLWKTSVDLDEPIAIFEDDVKFFRNYVPIEFEDVLILSLGKSSFYKEPWKSYLECPEGEPAACKWGQYSMPGASGYIIKPHAAKKLVKFYRHYYLPADNAINKGIVNIQIHNHLMGRNTTKEEGNISDRKANK